MDSLLFLCHRLPYPPNKGDKIRSFHFLQYLAQHYRIYLGTFIDDPEDEHWCARVREYCADLCAISINPGWRKVLSLRGLLTGEPLGLPYYRHARLAAWVRRTLKNEMPQRALVFSSTMAQYLLPGCTAAPTRVVVDFVDVDSEKWRAYAEAKFWPLKWIYRREGARLQQYEKEIARTAQASVFVSAPEAHLFNSLLDAPLSTVSHIDNGVDLAFFYPDGALEYPYRPDIPIVVFTGAMDYWANVDAVVWFAAEILPRVRAELGGTEFWIVGSRPSAQVKALGAQPGIRVTGGVPDIRPYLQHAHVVVAPLRIARGIQNKVLEAMAMSKTIVGTTAAFEGIAGEENPTLHVADDAPTFAQTCVDALRLHGSDRADTSGRRYVERAHDWNINLRKLHALLEA